MTVGERKLQRRRGARRRRRPPARAAAPARSTRPTPSSCSRAAPRLTGRLALVHAGANPVAQATAAAAAGARAVLLAEPRKRVLPLMPAGRVAAPVIGVTGAAAKAALDAKPGAR